MSHRDRLVDPAAFRFLRVGSKLIVAGRFTAAGAAQSFHAAIWDTETNTWSPFGSGFEGEDDEQVNIVDFGPDGSILFGGEFVLAGETPAASFAIWKRADEAGLAKGTAATGN